jgi:hypothetical protein
MDNTLTTWIYGPRSYADKATETPEAFTYRNMRKVNFTFVKLDISLLYHFAFIWGRLFEMGVTISTRFMSLLSVPFRHVKC